MANFFVQDLSFHLVKIIALVFEGLGVSERGSLVPVLCPKAHPSKGYSCFNDQCGIDIIAVTAMMPKAAVPVFTASPLFHHIELGMLVNIEDMVLGDVLVVWMLDVRQHGAWWQW